MKKALCLIIILLMAGITVSASFSDLEGHWAKPYVLPLAEEGIINGKTENTFDPDGQITRAEFLTMALKVANLPAELAFESWADVAPEQWFAKAAHTAKKADIVDPAMIQDNNLRPDAPILREEMTAVMMRLIHVMRGTTVDPAHNFTDAATFADWANDYIGKAAKLGIVTGNPDGSFNAKGSATRGEAAVMFSRLKKFLDETSLFTPAGEYSPVYDAIVYEGVDINKMINDAYAAGQKEITIAPGAYRIKSTPRGSHIRLENMKDFTVNGEGVILLLQTHNTGGFYLADCENVTINGFTLDWEKGAIFQGQIYNVDPDGYYFDIAVEPGYPHDFDSGKMDTTLQTAYFDGDTGLLKEMDSHLTSPTSYEKTGPNTYRLNSARSVASSGNAKVGDYIAAPVYITANATYITGGKNNTIKNFTSWSSYSSFIDWYGEGGTHYDNVCITRGPTPLGAISPRMVGSHGDGIHALVLRNGPIVTNCTFEHMLDDGIAIGNYRNYVFGREGNEALIRMSPYTPTYWVGDELAVYGDDTKEYARLTVKTVREYKVDTTQKILALTFEEGMPDLTEGNYVHNYSWACNGFEIRNTKFHNVRSRSMLVKGSNGLIENCEISHGGGYGLWISPERNWEDTGYSQNITIRNCIVFRSGWEDLETSAGISISGYEGQDHFNILIENCTFYENYNADLHISDGKNFTVKNCTFKYSEERNAPHTIEMENLTDVTLSGNQFDPQRENLIIGADKVTNLKQ